MADTDRPRSKRYVVSKESIKLILGSPIAFHRIFATLTGSALSGLFLSQCFYWSGKSSDEEGWFFKGHADWEKEIGMTRREVDTARRDCISLKFLEECKKGVPCRLYFRVDLDRLMYALDDPSLAESAKPVCRTSKIGGNVQPSLAESAKPYKEAEITTKNTTENTIPTVFSLTPFEGNNKESYDLPEWLPLVEWEAWKQDRKTRRIQVTPGAQKEALKKLAGLKAGGEDPAEVLRECVLRGWRGIFSVKNNYSKPSAKTSVPPDEAEDDLTKQRRKELQKRSAKA